MAYEPKSSVERMDEAMAKVPAMTAATLDDPDHPVWDAVADRIAKAIGAKLPNDKHGKAGPWGDMIALRTAGMAILTNPEVGVILATIDPMAYRELALSLRRAGERDAPESATCRKCAMD